MSGLADLTLGFIPLTDCAPLVVAKSLGLFAQEGLEVSLSREASWATIRDKVTVGALDGAHMLAPMALASGLASDGSGAPMLAPLALNLNGSAITVSLGLAAAMRALDPEGMAAEIITARPLARLVEQRKEHGAPPLIFAVVFPHSMHNYALRYWLAQAGVDPDREVRLVVTPPPRMVDHLQSGGIDGFCVGAPWNAVAMSQGVGEMLIKASTFWPGGPDKVFGLTQAWAERHPGELRAALRALLRAAAWCDEPGNHAELVALLSRPEHVGAEPEVVARALRQEIVFHRGAAGLPRREHALWFLSQMVRWAQVADDLDLAAVADRVYRPDLFREAALSIGPILGPAQAFEDGAASVPAALFDGVSFDPGDARGYAAGFAISRARA
ncbi:CmpA/NrtA family ABC transporter substrate-binding protein [Caulobacter sp. DWR3-1-2]|uniref:CmpA/NrtA family ABC transporter substrate-binding protein n=1 Tax=Caulobacter sp. DWR3-1-2 TaxID=2804647 RepID=UPI003CF8F1AD